ncbi:unnamed protein product [Moneuplotes crassus]|uniref:Uncharacterized protein n=1 Tax=Euplotes crassus TaxID=5936 RepID=A0AAD1Y7D4_EUPCR|nr:unnamed protein product [Moneuplotes crassus]
MFGNTLGHGSRGVSNSIASPGISSIFGGVTTSVEKPTQAASYAAAGAGAHVSQLRPQTQEKASVRYTPTFSSNAFGHADYAAPLSSKGNTGSRGLTSAGNNGISKKTQNTFESTGGASGKSAQPWDVNAYKEAHIAPAGSNYAVGPVKEVPKIGGAASSNWDNQTAIRHRKTQSQLDKEAFKLAEQETARLAKAQEAAEIARKKAERDAVNREMNQTLSQINARKRADWEAKKSDTTNLQQTQQLGHEIQELSFKSLQDRVSTQQQYRQELSKEKEQATRAALQQKAGDRELAKKLPGLVFECYQRDPAMKDQTKETGRYQKDQISEANCRKQREKHDISCPPEVFYTDKELAELRAEAEARNHELKSFTQSVANDQLRQHRAKVQSAQSSKRNTISQERAHLDKLQRLEQQDKEHRRRTKADRNQEMNSTLASISQAKAAAWEAAKADATNKLETEQLQSEIAQLTEASQQEKLRQTSEYRDELHALARARQHKASQDFHKIRHEEASSNGLVFECYARDPAMKEAHKQTGSFQQQQRQLEALRKKQDREAAIQPPPSLATAEQLEQLHSEAMSQHLERKLDLQKLMKTQYAETQKQKAAQLHRDKAQSQKEAARAAYLDEKMAHFEKEAQREAKQSYSHFLSGQLAEEKRRRQQECEERRHDPNIEKLAEEGQTMAEKVARYKAQLGL